MDWPHSPVHRLAEDGAYMVTAGTYDRVALFKGGDRLTLLRDELHAAARKRGWRLQAWAVMANHYHVVALSPEDAGALRDVLQELHSVTARKLNAMDRVSGRKVWYQYWDTRITYAKSYFARLRYVHENPVKHGLVQDATKYPWCSAGWFEREGDPVLVKTVQSFKIDRVRVKDDF